MGPGIRIYGGIPVDPYLTFLRRKIMTIQNQPTLPVYEVVELNPETIILETRGDENE